MQDFQVLQTNGSGVLSFSTISAGGITMSDMWRLTADKSLNSTPSDITANLERVDTTGFSVLGTGMTESSGIFTFPSTGHYLISAFGAGDCSGNNTQWVEFDIMVTLDNSSYSIASQIASSVGQANYYYGVFTTYTLDVTDTANIKVKFRVSAQNSSTSFFGNTTRNRSAFQFIRLGDT